MTLPREAKLELLSDGIYLKWTNDVVAGPFPTLERAEQFLDWCDNHQRLGRTVDVQLRRALGPGAFNESFDPC